MSATVAAAPARGLTAAEAAQRLAQRPPPQEPATSRSYSSIVRANVLTPFNVILLAFGVLTLAFGQAQDALFLGVVVANAGIGITQEVRAKRALDRLAALVAPTARVVRDGRELDLPVEAVVGGDLVRVQPGDQVVADGTVRDASGLRIDESILTGESDAVSRARGDDILSGSFVAEGTAAYEVTAVGEASYAARITGEARAFRHPRSPLELALNRLLYGLLAVMVPLGTILGFALWERHVSSGEAISTTVAAVVTLVPEGLVLLGSLTYAVAALRMARRGALAQQLNATESLASVDVLCLDKTGTLTEPRLRVREAVPSPGIAEEALADALARYAAATSAQNPTVQALAQRFTAPPEAPRAEVPFSSRWRWSGLQLHDGTYVLGAPELFELGALQERAESEASSGHRVIAFARATDALDGRDPTAGPPRAQPVGIVVLSEELRPDAAETVSYFARENVELKVISGDRAATVAAIARDVGIEGEVADASELPQDGPALARVLARTAVVGRATPADKKRIVEALAAEGRYVAMVGDGVNDVPALKAARLAIAQGSGTQMAKAVADVVLVRNAFGAVPPMVAEGRQVLRNLQRVAKLFLTKSVFATFLILSIGITPTAYPLLPRHLTLAASLTIGIPAFFLALAPSAGPYRPQRFLRDVARFAVPAGTAAGLGVVSGYSFALNVLDLHLRSARTVATTTLIIVGLYLILALESSGRRRTAAVTALCGVLALVYVLVLATPFTRSFFALSVPGPIMVLTALTGAAIAVAGLALTDERFVPDWRSARA
jgi:cation-transporting ATPase E